MDIYNQCIKIRKLFINNSTSSYYIILFTIQVSETENIRKNLAIERMIVEGCDILLDVNQVFVRQGTLIQVSRGRKCKLELEKVPSDGS